MVYFSSIKPETVGIMGDIEQAKALMEKALGILENKGIPSALLWLMKENFGRSEQVQLDKSRTEKDFEDCQKVKRFKFNEHSYELFFEKERDSSYPDGAYTESGDFRLLFDGEEVLKTSYIKNYPGDEWGSINYSLLLHENLTKKIKLKQWVEDLPKLVELERILKKQEEERWENEHKKKTAEEIFQNIHLGKYQKSEVGGNKTKKPVYPPQASQLWLEEKEASRKHRSPSGWLISGLKNIFSFILLLIGVSLFIKGGEVAIASWQLNRTIFSIYMILPAAMLIFGWILSWEGIRKLNSKE